MERTHKNFDAHNATCTICGMLALRDPWTHKERYAHWPEFIKDGNTYRFNSNGTTKKIRD